LKFAAFEMASKETGPTTSDKSHLQTKNKVEKGKKSKYSEMKYD
jgi:hypothetical protein